MYHQQRQPLKIYDIHPTSIKLITKGHPWITVDSFSEKFHPKDKFIVAANRRKPFALLIHDPTHTSIKARVWATSGNFQKQMKSFKNDLINRMRQAIKRRADSKYIKDRNHYYLIFGEADQVPGILVHYLNGEILIQFYMTFWEQYKDFFIQNLIKIVNEVFKTEVDFENIWFQPRSQIRQPAICSDFNVSFRNVTVEEYGVKYQVTLGKFYDHGIYTDMSSIRGRLDRDLKGAHSLLNLYAYTGAFSLYGLSKGVDEVVSVDLSKHYLEWLDKNIALNESFSDKAHTSLEMSTREALEKFKNEEKKFDFIICDPPSNSSDGNKMSNSLAEYKEQLPLINDLLSEHGKAVVFINTHKIPMKKFEDKIRQTIGQNKLPLKIKNKYYLSQDCPYKKGFPEGNYLKGLLLTRHDSSQELK